MTVLLLIVKTSNIVAIHLVLYQIPNGEALAFDGVQAQFLVLRTLDASFNDLWGIS